MMLDDVITNFVTFGLRCSAMPSGHYPLNLAQAGYSLEHLSPETQDEVSDICCSYVKQHGLMEVPGSIDMPPAVYTGKKLFVNRALQDHVFYLAEDGMVYYS